MTQIETITGTAYTAIISRHARGFTVAFGFQDRGGFQCTQPSRDFKSLAGAQKAGKAWAAK